MKFSKSTLFASAIVAAQCLIVQARPDFVLYDPNEPEIPPEPPFKAVMTVAVDEDTVGEVKFEIIPAWAPLGAKRFRELVKARYFDGNKFFRVLPDFAVQWGINGNPIRDEAFRGRQLPDEDIGEIDIEKNTKGTLVFANHGKNTRNTQMFVNMDDNPALDEEELFAPIGKVLDGMDLLEEVNSEYREQPVQALIQMEGEKYLNKYFPRLSWIKSVQIIDEGTELPGVPNGSDVPAEEG